MKTLSNMQAQLVDQNFANNILFMALSTMETYEYQLMKKLSNRSGQRLKPSQKEFGGYDKYDYSHKSLQEIRDQLINNVTLLANSKMGFDRQHGPNAYELPAKYNLQRVLQKVKYFNNKFYQMKDEDGVNLTLDIHNILAESNYKQLHCYKMEFKGTNPNGKNKNNQFIKNAVMATNDMHNEQTDIKGYINNGMKPSQLRFKQNKNYKQQINKNKQKLMVDQNQQRTKKNGKTYQQLNNSKLDFSNQSFHSNQNKFKSQLQKVKQPLQLILDSHKLTSQQLKSLPTITTLQCLSMNNNVYIDKQFVKSMLKYNPNLKTLKLNNASLNDNDLIQISNYFPDKLQDIQLNNNNITCQGLIYMFNNKKIKRLNTLSLAQNKLSNNTYHNNLFELFCKKCSQFKVKNLDISRNYLRQQHAKLMVQNFANLQQLVIGEPNGHGYLNTDGILNIIKSCKKLRILVLTSNNCLNQQVIKQISNLKSLQQLYITDKNQYQTYKQYLNYYLGKSRVKVLNPK